jgi:hypothetical protein
MYKWLILLGVVGIIGLFATESLLFIVPFLLAILLVVVLKMIKLGLLVGLIGVALYLMLHLGLV